MKTFQKIIVVSMLLGLFNGSVSAQILIDDNFSTWTSGHPTGWGRSDTMTIIQQNVNGARIVAPRTNDAVITGMDYRLSNTLAIGKRLQVTITVDSISNNHDFAFVVEGWTAGNKTVLLKKGVNQFTVDLTFPTNYVYFNDNIAAATGTGPYPHIIIVKNVKLEIL